MCDEVRCAARGVVSAAAKWEAKRCANACAHIKSFARVKSSPGSGTGVK